MISRLAKKLMFTFKMANFANFHLYYADKVTTEAKAFIIFSSEEVWIYPEMFPLRWPFLDPSE